MRRDSGSLPSLMWRVGVRLALVFAIQVLVMGILVLVAPPLVRGLGDIISQSRQSALAALLEDNASDLARAAAVVVVAPEGDGAAAVPPESVGPWQFVVRAGAGEAPVAVPMWLSEAAEPVVAQLETTVGADGLSWAYLLHDGALYAIGARRMGEPEGAWLLLVEQADDALARAVGRLSGEGATFEVAAADQGAGQGPSYGAFMRGELPVTADVPNAVGPVPLQVRFSVSVLPLTRIFRAGALVLAASFLLLTGSLLLAFLSVYTQVMQPFNARLRALSEYALTGKWEAPSGGFREHQVANDAITEAVQARERAEREARQRMTELRTFMDSIPAHVVVKDADLKLRLVNEAFCRFLGRSSEELLGKTDADLFPESLAATYGEHDREVLRLGRQQQYEEECYVDGRKRYYRVVKAPITDPDGAVTSIVGIALDITEQKDLERHLAEAQKMQGVGRLAGGLSHAFNNLLTAIIGSAELAMLSLADGHAARDEVQQIRDAAERGGALSRQLLTLSRQHLAKTAVTDTNRLVGEMVPVLRDSLGDKITVETALSADAPSVKADPTQLRQLILNLAINAGESMPAGGPVRITTRRCEAPRGAIAIEPLLGTTLALCLTVEDKGTGIPADARAHVFEPYFTTKSASQGRGLGLSVAYSIARQHKGVILYESEVGKGTVFTVYLPAVDAEPAVEPPPPSPGVEAPRGREVVLLAEDDALVRQLAERLLVAQGYTVWPTDSGEGALALLEEAEREPDLLLSDVMMPGISGIELARALQKERPGIRVLLMSGYAGDTDQGTMAGFPMLWKPFNLQTLAQRVRAVLDA